MSGFEAPYTFGCVFQNKLPSCLAKVDPVGGFDWISHMNIMQIESFVFLNSSTDKLGLEANRIMNLLFGLREDTVKSKINKWKVLVCQ